MASSSINKQSFTRLVDGTRQKLHDVRDNPPAIEAAIKECSRNIRMMNVALKAAKFVQEKQHITDCLGKMHGFRMMLKALRGITGSGFKPSNPNKKNYTNTRVKWVDVESAFSYRIRTGCVVNLRHKDPIDFLKDAETLFTKQISIILKKEWSVKVNAVFCGEFKVVKQGNEFYEFKYMKSKNALITQNTEMSLWFERNIKQSILQELDEFQERDSGWALDAIVNITFNINKYTPLHGSSYIELPRQIKAKKACINVQNNDEACFSWAVTSALHPAPGKIAQRCSSYPHYTKVLNLRNVTMPVTTNQIPRFEKQNDLSINVYILEKCNRGEFRVLPTFLTENKQKKHINLLLIQNDYVNDNENGDREENEAIPRYHYVWIKNFSRLVSSQLSKHDGKVYVCDRCLHYFINQQKLNSHMENCIKQNHCKLSYPVGDRANVQFKNHKNKERAPFVIYADLECFLKPEEHGNSFHKGAYQRHIPYSAGYYVKCSYDESLSYYRSHRGENCEQWLVEELRQFAEDVNTVFLCPLPMEPLTPTEEMEFHSTSRCHICDRSFQVNDVRVRDHCHLTGTYRGPAHEGCNINYKDSHVIPVIFHNLSGYDSHFIIKNLAKDFEGDISVLPINKEKYISFTKQVKGTMIHFRFIDSFRFLASGLETLASYLTQFPNLKSQFSELGESKFKLLSRKGVFPYDYIDSTTRLEDTKLPDISKFYNRLNNSNITSMDYAHACSVWNIFDCKNLGDYSDLYLKTDVLLLADVFERFRLSSLKTYSLDPAHYFTLPGFTWDCMLKYSDINLDLLTDPDMILFIERGIRGGLSQCSKRYTKANNKYMSEYDRNMPSKFLMYNDINNQYGWAMSQHLPYGGFEWIEDIEKCIWDVPADNSEGFILEVDLEYPASIHDTHSDLPFCAEHRASPNSHESKLMATLYNKKRYVIHYRNLRQAIDNGLKLTKIHKILKFQQSTWLKSYIDLNTKLRQNAANEFEKQLFKLMNNAIFGKTMENVRKYSIVKLVTKWEGRYGAEALIAKPNFKSSTIFDENLVAIELNKTEVLFNKPIYVGMCILDISKLKIYDFHYSYMRSRFGDRAKVCYTDTDSLIYEVETPDLYEVIKRDAKEYYDTSDYPENNVYNIPRVNKKVLGMMKDENVGSLMTEFVGLRSKMYATRVEDKDKDKKAKGVKRHIIKNSITFYDYTNCLEQSKDTIVTQNLIRSKKHDVFSISQHKVALSPHDDKRYLIPKSYDTLPWGHWRIMDDNGHNIM